MFITIEGPDGSGKTSQVKPLVEFLLSKGYPIFSAREPGSTAISEQVREIIMRLDNTAMHPRTETLLFCSARAQLVEEVIRPRLAKGEIVLLDRYADSTLAYQGYGHGLPLDRVRAVIGFATGELQPDLTVLLDLDVELGLQRRSKGGEWNRLDAYAVEFHRRVRRGYQHLAQAEPQRWVTIDAAQAPEQVQSDLRQVITERLQGALARWSPETRR
jgi:dTMP kinase